MILIIYSYEVLEGWNFFQKELEKGRKEENRKYIESRDQKENGVTGEKKSEGTPQEEEVG